MIVSALERDKVQALKAFKTYLVRYQIKGRTLTFRLRFYINDWLAQPDRVEHFKLDSRPLHEVVAIADSIEKDFRDRWKKTANETRAKKKNPTPRKDPRIGLLI